MKRKLRILTPASKELVQAKKWYSRREPLLGRKLILSFEGTFRLIQQNPEMFVEIEPGVRKALVNRFPYLILFQITDDEIRIVSIRHQAQSSEERQ